MLTNYHTHTTFCDGKNNPEEIVLSAIEKGFLAIGFSGHGYMPFDLSYCMKETEKYIQEINALKDKYGKKIEIYCGVEEDAYSYIKRADFDYIIGSAHNVLIDGKYCPVDLDYDSFKEYLKAFDNDVIKFSKAYYEDFVGYIKKRRPDIVGHFDLITKFDEIDEKRFLNNSEYLKLSEEYLKYALESDAIFEVNTGAISRGIRKTPYPYENLLYLLKKNDGKIILSSDSHSAETLDFYFDETKYMLKNIGFGSVYEFHHGEFKKTAI